MNQQQHRKLVMDLTRQALANGVPSEVFTDVRANLTVIDVELTRAFMLNAQYKRKSWKSPTHFNNDLAKFKREAIENLLEKN